jgi:hypothetical protein
MTIDYLSLDRNALAAHNARQRGTPFELLVDWGPSPGAGDFEGARVIVLLANGGYKPGVDRLEPIRFEVPGWPLPWLHPDAAEVHPGAHEFVRTRLRWLIERFGAQRVSQTVATLNVCPWASTSFPSGLTLPSYAVQVEIARRAAHRGAVLVAVRARRHWAPVLDRAVLTRAPRAAHLSPGNLGADGWARVVEAIER